MNAKKVFSAMILILGLVMITATTNAAGLTYESAFDPRISTAPVEGTVSGESLNHESFFDMSLSTAPAKGIKYDAQYPMICWGGAECLIN